MEAVAFFVVVVFLIFEKLRSSLKDGRISDGRGTELQKCIKFKVHSPSFCSEIVTLLTLPIPILVLASLYFVPIRCDFHSNPKTFLISVKYLANTHLSDHSR